MTKFDPEYFKEKFPHLTEEINSRTEAVSLDSVRTDSDEAEKASYPDRDKGPTVTDFIRLCEDEDEAIEIINYLLEKGKINQERAKKLRRQLVNRGLRSFGSKREPGEFE